MCDSAAVCLHSRLAVCLHSSQLFVYIISDYNGPFIEYVKGYTPSMQGAPMLVDQNDYCYKLDKRSKTTCRLFWRCSVDKKSFKCNARVVSIGDKIVKMSSEHTHPVDVPMKKQRKKPLMI